MNTWKEALLGYREALSSRREKRGGGRIRKKKMKITGNPKEGEGDRAKVRRDSRAKVNQETGPVEDLPPQVEQGVEPEAPGGIPQFSVLPQDSDLANVMMAWYWAGYYSAVYQFKQCYNG